MSSKDVASKFDIQTCLLDGPLGWSTIRKLKSPFYVGSMMLLSRIWNVSDDTFLDSTTYILGFSYQLFWLLLILSVMLMTLVGDIKVIQFTDKFHKLCLNFKSTSLRRHEVTTKLSFQWCTGSELTIFERPFENSWELCAGHV